MSNNANERAQPWTKRDKIHKALLRKMCSKVRKQMNIDVEQLSFEKLKVDCIQYPIIALLSSNFRACSTPFQYVLVNNKRIEALMLGFGMGTFFYP